MAVYTATLVLITLRAIEAVAQCIVFSSSRRQFQILQVAFNVGNNVITSSSIVRDPGIYLDSSITAHISRKVSNCFAALRQVCSVRRSLPMRVMSSLVTVLVLTRLDCGNAMLAGLPTHQLNCLQSVLHAAARLVCGAWKYDHVTPPLVVCSGLDHVQTGYTGIPVYARPRSGLPCWDS